MINWADTIGSQYKSGPIISALIESFNDCIDPSADIDLFYQNIFNVATATGPGLDVWGRIVGVGRVLKLPAATYLTFSEASDPNGGGFGTGILYNGMALTTNYALSDNDFRTLIYAKAAYNITNGSIPAINHILMLLFGASGQAYVIDNGNMSMTYRFKFTMTPVQYAIATQSGALPRPAGRMANVVQGA